MILDGDMQCFSACELGTSATSSVRSYRDVLEAGHAFNAQVRQITGRGMFLAHNRRSWMQITPVAQMSAPQDAADRSRTDCLVWAI